MIESEGITENVKTWIIDIISKTATALPMDEIMFEGKSATKLSLRPD